MLAWLVIAPWLVFASMTPGERVLNVCAVLPNDVLGIVFASLGFADLYQASCASKNFRTVADGAIRALHGIQHNGKTFLNYTKISHELDALVQDIAKNKTVPAAIEALNASPHFTCIRLILEAQFGYCIQVAKGGLPRFCLRDLYFDILSDEHGISALPYTLDQMGSAYPKAGLLSGLLDSGRFDLLAQLRFPGISSDFLDRLMAIGVPGSVVVVAIESFESIRPAPGSSDLPFWASFAFQKVPLAEGCTIPLFLVRYLHERGVEIPKGAVFSDGLKQSAIGFWKYVLERDADEAKSLVDLALAHGSPQAKIMARTFY